MTSPMPWFRVYPADVLIEKAYRGLSNDELGVVVRCLAIHMLDGGVPSNSVDLGRALGLRPTSATKYQQILQKFFVPFRELPADLAKVVEENFGNSEEIRRNLFSLDLLDQTKAYQETCLKNQANGRMGGRPRRVTFTAENETGRLSQENRPPSEEEREAEGNKNQKDLDCLSSGGEEKPRTDMYGGHPGTEGKVPVKGTDVFPDEDDDVPEDDWNRLPGKSKEVGKSNPVASAEVSQAANNVLGRWSQTAKEVGLQETTEAMVAEMKDKLLARVAEDGWQEDFELACCHIIKSGKSWWTKNQPKYGLRNLLEDGKAHEFAEKWRTAQVKREQAASGLPPSVEEVLGTYKPVFDELLTLFPQMCPFPDAVLTKELLDSGKCTAEQLLKSAHLRFQTVSGPGFMPKFNQWVKDGGYLVDHVAAHPGRKPSTTQTPAHRAEADSEGNAQILARKRKTTNNPQENHDE